MRYLLLSLVCMLAASAGSTLPAGNPQAARAGGVGGSEASDAHVQATDGDGSTITVTQEDADGEMVVREIPVASNGTTSITVAEQTGEFDVESGPLPGDEERVIVEFVTPPLRRAGAGADIVSRVQQIEAERAQLRAALASMGRGRRFKEDFRSLFNGVALSLPLQAARAVERLPFVKRVWPDVELETADDTSNGIIGAPGAWSTGATGAGVRIAIIDTGIDYTHPDLGGCFGEGCKVTGGWDVVHGDADPFDDHGHGTHVAGIAAANGTLTGVAPDATLLAYKALSSDGSGFESWIIAAIEIAVDPDGDPSTEDGADVINMSLGGPGDGADPLSMAVNEAVAAGVVVVVAAGNSGPGYLTMGSPARAADAITVGASDGATGIAEFSSRGPEAITYSVKPELVAPGVGIQSSVPTGTCLLCNGSGYLPLNGTSMATPHVAGAAALLLGARPASTPAMVKATLMGTAAPLEGVDVATQGAGMLQADAALASPLLASPGSVSFDPDDGSAAIYTSVRTIEIANVSGDVQPFTCAVQFDTPGITGSCGSAEGSLAPGASASMPVEIVADNAVVPDLNGPPYVYAGRIEITSGAGTVALPAVFSKSKILDLTFDEPVSWGSVHNQGRGVWTRIPSGVTHVRLLVPADTYDVMVRFEPGWDEDGVWAETFVVEEGITVETTAYATLERADAVYRLSASIPWLTPGSDWGGNVYLSRLAFQPGTSGVETVGFSGQTWSQAPPASTEAVIRVSCLGPNYRTELGVRMKESTTRAWNAYDAWQGACADVDHSFAEEDFTRYRFDYTNLDIIDPMRVARLVCTIRPSSRFCFESTYWSPQSTNQTWIDRNGTDEEFATRQALPDMSIHFIGRWLQDGFDRTVAHAQSAYVNSAGGVEVRRFPDASNPYRPPSGIIPIGLGPLTFDATLLWTSTGDGLERVRLFGGNHDQTGSYIRVTCPAFVATPPGSSSPPLPCRFKDPPYIDLNAESDTALNIAGGMDDYAVAGGRGRMHVEYQMDLIGRYGLSPDVQHLRILGDGEAIDVVGAVEEVVLEFQRHADACALDFTFDVSYDEGATWTPLPYEEFEVVSSSTSWFRAELPVAAIDAPSISFRSTSVNCYGTSSMSLEYLPALRMLDSDGDELYDAYEVHHTCLQVAVADADSDGDSDGVVSITEHVLGTLPCNPDSDGDGVPDGIDMSASCLDGPLSADDPNADPDGDGLNASGELQHGTDLCIADTDGDGLADGDEVFTTGTDPLRRDSDGDALNDAAEINTHFTNPLLPDSDGDGMSDGDEVWRRIDPLTPNPDAENPDDDGDGCSDDIEVTADERFGGARDPLFYWDFFEVTGDGIIDFSDALDVLGFFGDPGAPGTPGDLRDRAPSSASTPWKTTVSDGGVDFNDVLTSLSSFGHSCAGP